MVDQAHFRQPFPPATYSLPMLSSFHLQWDSVVVPLGKGSDKLDIPNVWLAMQYHTPNENGGDSFYCLTNRFDPQLYIHKDKSHRLPCRFLGLLHHYLHRRREWPNRIYRNRMIGKDFVVELTSLHPLKILVRQRTLRRAVKNNKMNSTQCENKERFL